MSEDNGVGCGDGAVNEAVDAAPAAKRVEPSSAKEQLRSAIAAAKNAPWGWKKIALVSLGAAVIVGVGGFVFWRWYTSPTVAAADVKAAGLPV